MWFTPNLIRFCLANGLSDVPRKRLNYAYHLLCVLFHFTSLGLKVVLTEAAVTPTHQRYNFLPFKSPWTYPCYCECSQIPLVYALLWLQHPITCHHMIFPLPSVRYKLTAGRCWHLCKFHKDSCQYSIFKHVWPYFGSYTNPDCVGGGSTGITRIKKKDSDKCY